MTEPQCSPDSAATMLRELLHATRFHPVDMFLRKRCEAALDAVAQTTPRRVDDHMLRARRLVENHIEAYGMVPHPDRIKEAIAEQSQESFDLGFQAAGGAIASLSSTERRDG